MRENRLVLAATVAVLLGCSSEPSQADDQKDATHAEKKDDDKKEAPAKKDAEKKDVKKHGVFKATVIDRSPEVKPIEIDEAVLWVPQISIFSSNGGDPSWSLKVKHGAAEIEVPF